MEIVNCLIREREHCGGGVSVEGRLLYRKNGWIGKKEEKNIKMKDIVYEFKIEATYNEEYLSIS